MVNVALNLLGVSSFSICNESAGIADGLHYEVAAHNQHSKYKNMILHKTCKSN